jgi:hypothetical protein
VGYGGEALTTIISSGREGAEMLMLKITKRDSWPVEDSKWMLVFRRWKVEVEEESKSKVDVTTEMCGPRFPVGAKRTETSMPL